MHTCISRFWFPFVHTPMDSCEFLRIRTGSNASGSPFRFHLFPGPTDSKEPQRIPTAIANCGVGFLSVRTRRAPANSCGPTRGHMRTVRISGSRSVNATPTLTNSCGIKHTYTRAFRISDFRSFQLHRIRTKPCDLVWNQTRSVRVSMFRPCKALRTPANSDELLRTQTVAFRVSGVISFQP